MVKKIESGGLGAEAKVDEERKEKMKSVELPDLSLNIGRGEGAECSAYFILHLLFCHSHFYFYPWELELLQFRMC